MGQTSITMVPERNDSVLPGRSRRELLRAGGIVSGGLLLAGCAGRDEGPGGSEGTLDTTDQDVVGKAFMFVSEYRPGAKFRVVSPVVEESPDVEGIQEQDVWAEANTRFIEYLNTGERVSLFPIRQANIEQGEVYELSTHTMSLFGREEGIVSIEYERPDEEAVVATKDVETVEGGGKALVRTNNVHPGSMFEVISGVVDWRPQEDVRQSDVFAEYNTRYGEYLNANDEFLFYPAGSASIEEGAVYVVREQMDLSSPGDAMVTVDLDRVDEASLRR